MIIALTEDVGFYVTVIRNPGPKQRTGCLLGPYATEEEAGAEVDAGRELACDADPFMAFDFFGVSKVSRAGSKALPAGRLNGYRELQRG